MSIKALSGSGLSPASPVGNAYASSLTLSGGVVKNPYTGTGVTITIGTVNGAGPYTSTITLTGTSPAWTSAMVVNSVLQATAGSGSLGTGTVTVTSVASSTSVNISSTATIVAGTITDLLIVSYGTGVFSAPASLTANTTLSGGLSVSGLMYPELTATNGDIISDISNIITSNKSLTLEDAIGYQNFATTISWVNSNLTDGLLSFKSSIGGKNIGIGFLRGTAQEAQRAASNLTSLNRTGSNINSMMLGYTTAGPRIFISDYDVGLIGSTSSANVIRLVSDTTINTGSLSVTGSINNDSIYTASRLMFPEVTVTNGDAIPDTTGSGDINATDSLGLLRYSTMISPVGTGILEANLVLKSSIGNKNVGIGFLRGTNEDTLRALSLPSLGRVSNINSMMLGYTNNGPRIFISDYDIGTDPSGVTGTSFPNTIRLVASTSIATGDVYVVSKLTVAGTVAGAVAPRCVISPGSFIPNSVGPALAYITTGSDKYELQYADGTDRIAYTTFSVPYNYSGGSIQIKIYWYISSGTNSQVRWEGWASSVVSSGAINSAPALVASVNAGAATGATASTLVISTMTWSTSLPAAGSLLYFGLKRVPSDTNDTSGASANVQAVAFEFGS